jgi:hypothetical protein
MRFLLLLMILTSPFCLRAQERLRDEMIPMNIPWADGSVMLKDGTEIKGVIKHNDKAELLHFQNGDDTRTLTPRGVVAFEYYDEEVSGQRLFYSLEYADEESGIKKYHFFEVLREFKSFAVLSTTSPIKIEQKSSTNSAFATNPGTLNYERLEYSQVETIVFMNEHGDLEPYVRIVEKDIDGAWFDYDKTKNKFIDKEVFGKYAGKNWTAILQFADENKLKFKRRTDLMKALNHLATLEAR